MVGVTMVAKLRSQRLSDSRLVRFGFSGRSDPSLTRSKESARF